MTAELQRPSAKIYAFPPGGRAPGGADRSSARPAGRTAAAEYASAGCGSGWYHEAAVEEAERLAKRAFAKPVRPSTDHN